MSARDRWAQALEAAVSEGVLSDSDSPGAGTAETRPWPVVLLTAFGAWLAAIPLCGFVGVLLTDLIWKGGAVYLIGAVCLVGAVGLLRARQVALFVEQLAVPGLLVGGCLLAFGLYRDLSGREASAALLAVSLGVAVVVPQAWLRACLGSAAAGLTLMVLILPEAGRHASLGSGPWWALHGLVLAWLGMLAMQRVSGPQPALTLESLAAGWVLFALAGFAVLSGMTFMVGGATGLWFPAGGWHGEDLVVRVVSAMLAAAAFGVLVLAWPSARRPAWGIAALVGVALAGAMPTLGGLLFILAACAGTGRWRLAGAAALGAAWVVGAFYYRMDASLAHKALMLVAAGVVLGAIAWWTGPRRAPVAAPASADHFTLPPALVPVTVALCLLVVNIGIWQKEAVIAHGRTVLVELAPVDPRSLAQGDYMALNFRLPPVAARPRPNDLPPHVVMQVDERGVAIPLRIELAGEEAPVLAPGELRIEMSAKDGRWVLVTDAWFFKEGNAERFAAARYGEFRIMPDGDALLIGLRDTRLVPIAP